MQLTVIVAPLEVLIPNGLGRVNGLPGRVGPLSEVPEPEKELSGEVPKLVIGLLASLLGLARHGPTVESNDMRNLLPQFRILIVVGFFVRLQLKLIHLVENLFSARQKLHQGATAHHVHELRVLANFLLRGVLPLLEDGVVGAEGGVVFSEDFVNLWGVAVVRAGRGLPKGLSGQHLEVAGLGRLVGIFLGLAAERVWEGYGSEVGVEGRCVGEVEGVVGKRGERERVGWFGEPVSPEGVEIYGSH